MDEKKQIQLSDINNILEVLKSIVSKSFMSNLKSEGQNDAHPEAAIIFPVISINYTGGMKMTLTRKCSPRSNRRRMKRTTPLLTVS